MAGLSGVLAHAAIDYHLRESAVAAVVIVAIATSRVWGQGLLNREPADRAARGTRLLALPCLALSLFLALQVPSSHAHDESREAALRSLATAEGSDVRSDREAAVTAALNAARRGAAVRPDSGDAWSLLAKAEFAAAKAKGRARSERTARDEHRTKALTASVRALELAPSAMGVAHRAGSILLSAGADDEAMAAARLGLLVGPGSSEAHFPHG